jgi:hypothetical protein
LKRRGDVIEHTGPGVIWIEPRPSMARVLEALSKFDCESVSAEIDGNKINVSAVIKIDVEVFE